MERRSKNAGGAVVGLAAIGLAVAYLAMASQPGQHDKDWVHLWVGGAMVVEGDLERLYSPPHHRALLEQAYPDGVPEALWPQRNQRLGVFFYPPPTALGYAMFAWLPMQSAATAASVFAVLLAAYCSLVLKWVSGNRLSWATGLLFLLAYPPFFYNFALGQNGIVTLAVVMTAWLLADRHRDLWAGAVLGLLICKPNWFAALMWIPLVHGRWRMIGGAALSAVCVAGGTVLFSGPAVFAEYAALLPKVMQLPAEAGYVLRLKYSALGVFRKWFGPGDWSTILGWACGCTVVAATIWHTRGQWRPGTAEFRRVVVVSLLAAVWFNPHINNYDLLFVAMACAAIARPAAWVPMALIASCYLSGPLDNSWDLWPWLPLPSFALIGLWWWWLRHAETCPRTTSGWAALPRCTKMMQPSPSA
jgi:hypothetical protein